MKDLNEKVEKDREMIAKYGFRSYNEHDGKCIYQCIVNNQIIANSWFEETPDTCEFGKAIKETSKSRTMA